MIAGFTRGVSLRANVKQGSRAVRNCFPIIFLFFACQSGKKIDTKSTELDKLVEAADQTIVNDPTTMLNQLSDSLLTDWSTLYETDETPNRDLHNPGLVQYKAFADSITNPKIYLFLYAYKTERSALTAFRDWIDFQACCVPDEDIVKLKNFTDINPFKNGASKILYTDNMVITMYTGDHIKDNKKFNEYIDSHLNSYNFKKLEIGRGGPAKWTIRQLF